MKPALLRKVPTRSAVIPCFCFFLFVSRYPRCPQRSGSCSKGLTRQTGWDGGIGPRLARGAYQQGQQTKSTSHRKTIPRLPGSKGFVTKFTARAPRILFKSRYLLQLWDKLLSAVTTGSLVLATPDFQSWCRLPDVHWSPLD